MIRSKYSQLLLIKKRQERSIKLLNLIYNKENNSNLRFFLKKKYFLELDIFLKYKNFVKAKLSKNLNLYMHTIFLYSIIIKSNQIFDIFILLKNKFLNKNLFIFKKESQIYIGMNNLNLFVLLFQEIKNLKNKFLLQSGIIEIQKLLVKYPLYSLEHFLKINFHFFHNLKFNIFLFYNTIFNNFFCFVSLILIKIYILLSIFLIYQGIYYIHCLSYYGYFKAVI